MFIKKQPSGGHWSGHPAYRKSLKSYLLGNLLNFKQRQCKIEVMDNIRLCFCRNHQTTSEVSSIVSIQPETATFHLQSEQLQM